MISIINEIIKKFTSEYALAFATGLELAPPAPAASAFAHNKQSAFWERYNADANFKKQMGSSYAYKKQDYFDFWLIFDELREYLEPELKRAEVILIERGKASALSLKQLERAVSEARSAEELQRHVLEEQSFKLNIWVELERRLSETRI